VLRIVDFTREATGRHVPSSPHINCLSHPHNKTGTNKPDLPLTVCAILSILITVFGISIEAQLPLKPLHFSLAHIDLSLPCCDDRNIDIDMPYSLATFAPTTRKIKTATVNPTAPAVLHPLVVSGLRRTGWMQRRAP
jgi:hypothetical protein